MVEVDDDDDILLETLILEIDELDVLDNDMLVESDISGLDDEDDEPDELDAIILVIV